MRWFGRVHWSAAAPALVPPKVSLSPPLQDLERSIAGLLSIESADMSLSILTCRVNMPLPVVTKINCAEILMKVIDSALDDRTPGPRHCCRWVSVAIGSSAVCLEWSPGRALAAGASQNEIADVLLAVAPVTGSAGRRRRPRCGDRAGV